MGLRISERAPIGLAHFGMGVHWAWAFRNGRPLDLRISNVRRYNTLRQPKREAGEPVVLSVARKLEPLILESAHPYKNNTNQKIPVSVPGASRLIISFDPRTKTEIVNDYVKIFSKRTRRLVGARCRQCVSVCVRVCESLCVLWVCRA